MSVRRGVFKRVVDVLLALLYERFVACCVAKAQQPVDVVGGLLVAPPVLSVLAHARNLARPETCVVGIAQRFGVSAQPLRLDAARLRQPSGGTRLRQHPVRELRARGASPP